MYRPSSQLKTHSRFIGLIALAAASSSFLAHLSGQLYASDKPAFSLIAALASSVPSLFVGYQSFSNRLEPVYSLNQLELLTTRSAFDRGVSPTEGRELPDSPQHPTTTTTTPLNDEQPTQSVEIRSEINARNLMGNAKHDALMQPVPLWLRASNAFGVLTVSKPTVVTGLCLVTALIVAGVLV